jgi:hypothetical protein
MTSMAKATFQDESHARHRQIDTVSEGRGRAGGACPDRAGVKTVSFQACVMGYFGAVKVLSSAVFATPGSTPTPTVVDRVTFATVRKSSIPKE